MDVKGVVDDICCIANLLKVCPEEYHAGFLASLAELENNYNHVKRNYPVSRFHIMEGTGDYQAFRFDIDKMSGWRCFAQFRDDHRLHLCGISEKKYHDKPMEFIKTHKDYFEKKKK